MIRFKALGVDFSLPLLSLLAPVLATRLGMKLHLSALLIALSVHELAHILAARCMGVAIREIRLLPFGGSAELENPYGLPALQAFVTAAAGPAANLLLCIFSAAMTHWGLLDPKRSGELIRISLLLMCFNLLPALPLDGGRILLCLLRRIVGERRGLRSCLWMSRGLAALLLLGTLLLRLNSGRWNLSLCFAAVFILSSGQGESAALRLYRARRMGEELRRDETPKPARLVHIDGGTRLQEALQLLRPRERLWFILTEEGAPISAIDSGSILRSLAEGADPGQQLGSLKGLRLWMEGAQQYSGKQKSPSRAAHAV